MPDPAKFRNRLPGGENLADNDQMENIMDKLRALALAHRRATPTPSAIEGLTIWHSDTPTAPTPAMFEPAVYVLLQGSKRLTIGTHAIDFGAGNYSAAPLGLPFTGQVLTASPETPYMGVGIKLDVGLIASLLLDMPPALQPKAPRGEPADLPAMAVTPVTSDIIEPLYRLLRLLDAPQDIAALAPLIKRELYYRLLQGALGGTLSQAVQSHTRLGQVRRAVEWLCANATEPMSVEALASQVGMSVTSFHRHFKAVTGLSPLAYQRQLRLLHARRLLNEQAASVTAVAFEVGYASASQFSREYTRLFGRAPLHDTVRARQAVLVQ